MELHKIVLKVLNTERDKIEWVHVSYMDRNLYNRFVQENDLKYSDLNDYFSRWAKEDFNITLSMSSTNDIKVLKKLVRGYYKRAHPEIFIDSTTDRQGWMRMWLTRKIKEELKIYGEESI